MREKTIEIAKRREDEKAQAKTSPADASSTHTEQNDIHSYIPSHLHNNQQDLEPSSSNKGAHDYSSPDFKADEKLVTSVSWAGPDGGGAKESKLPHEADSKGVPVANAKKLSEHKACKSWQ